MAEDRFRIEFDPASVESSVKELGERIRKLVDQGRYTKVRLRYKGKQIAPDIPLVAFLAVEGASLWLIGPLQILALNFGMKTFLDVELVHEAGERVREGIDLFTVGEVDAAEAKYREALQMNPGDAGALYNLGVLLRVTGRRDEAIEAFEGAAKVADHPDAVRASEALEKMRRGGKTL